MTHLSSEQVSAWTLGEREPEAELHLESCVSCRTDVIRLQEGLRAFRQSVHDWAERPVSIELPARRATSSVSWAWTAATAVATGLALLPLYLDVRQAHLEARNTQDSALLDEVQTRLSRNVPQSMQNLMALMDEGAEGKEKQQ